MRLLLRVCLETRSSSNRRITSRYKPNRFAFTIVAIAFASVAYAENVHGVVFIQWHMVGICIWCALFVTSQFNVIFMFPNQRFGEVCWHNVYIYSSTRTLLILCVTALNINHQRFKNLGGKYTQRYDTAVHNCKNIRLRVKIGEQRTPITASEQFTMAKWGCADAWSKQSSISVRLDCLAHIPVCKIESC